MPTSNQQWVWEKRGAHLLVHGDLQSGSTRYWNYPEDWLMVLCRQTLGSERHRYEIAWPDKLGTDPMAYGGLNKYMDAAAELGRNPVSKHHIQPQGYGKWEGWCGTERLNPSRETKFSGTYGDRGIFIFSVQLTTSRIGNLTRFIHTLL